jgi:hypothetical protein
MAKRDTRRHCPGTDPAGKRLASHGFDQIRLDVGPVRPCRSASARTPVRAQVLAHTA